MWKTEDVEGMRKENKDDRELFILPILEGCFGVNMV